MNTAAAKVSKITDEAANAAVATLDESILARQAKMEAMKKHGITVVKVLGLIGLGVAGTIGFDKIKARKASNTPALGYEPSAPAAAE